MDWAILSPRYSPMIQAFLSASEALGIDKEFEIVYLGGKKFQ